MEGECGVEYGGHPYIYRGIWIPEIELLTSYKMFKNVK